MFSYSQAEIPKLPDIGNSLNKLGLQGWRLLSSDKGDLNRDGIDDIAFVIQNTDKKYFKFNNRLGIDTLNLNPRILAIYFGKSDGTFKKKLQSNKFILLQDSPTMDEPFDGLTTLQNGVLQINFKFWYSAGSWYMSNHQYKFRYKNNKFEFIGYESNERHRATGKTTYYSINFLTKKMNIKTTIYDEQTDEEKSTEKWKQFELKELKTISTLKKPFEWEFENIFL